MRGGHKGGYHHGNDNNPLAQIWRYVRLNPLHLVVLTYAIIVTLIAYRKSQPTGPFVWAVHGYSPHHKGSCFCGADDYCLCSPSLAIDTILEYRDEGTGAFKGYVFVKRKDGRGTAVVGGFVDIGETVEAAVEREVMEETGARVKDLRLLGVYSNPKRDDRRHTVSTVYLGSLTGELQAGDDAKQVVIIPPNELEGIKFAFDHGDIIQDYLDREERRELRPREGTVLCKWSE